MERSKLTEESIFHVARRVAPGEPRAAYLDRICGEDRALRERIEALVCIFEEEESFLESPPADSAAMAGNGQSILDESPGRMIGPYKLLQPIGEGGMGAVY